MANRRLKGIKFFQTVLSSTVATSVAVASVIFFVLLNPQVGYFKVNWLAEPNQVLFGVSLSSVWQNLGPTFIIVLAGLQAVPDELVESATSTAPGRCSGSSASPAHHLAHAAVPDRGLTVFAFQAFAPRSTSSPPAASAGASETLVFKIFQRQQPIDLGRVRHGARPVRHHLPQMTMGQFMILGPAGALWLLTPSP